MVSFVSAYRVLVADGDRTPARVGLWGVVAIGVGGMVGGGIFAVLGLSVQIAKGGAPVAFLVAGAVALLTARSYALLSKSYPSAGGTVTFITKGFGTGLFGGSLNVLLWLSYIVMLSLYSQAFGSYAASLSPHGAQPLPRHVFLSAAVVVITVLNAGAATTVARAERVVVVIKLLILVLFVAVSRSFAASDLTPRATASLQWGPEQPSLRVPKKPAESNALRGHTRVTTRILPRPATQTCANKNAAHSRSSGTDNDAHLTRITPPKMGITGCEQQSASRQLTTVLLALDDSPESQHAAHVAARLFNEADTKFYVLNVARPPIPIAGGYFGESYPLMFNWLELMDHLAKDETSELRDEIAGAGITNPEVIVKFGDPVTKICECANEHNVDVIVVGSHDKGFLRRLVDPSVADGVIHAISRPVLVVNAA